MTGGLFVNKNSNRGLSSDLKVKVFDAAVSQPTQGAINTQTSHKAKNMTIDSLKEQDHKKNTLFINSAKLRLTSGYRPLGQPSQPSGMTNLSHHQ